VAPDVAELVPPNPAELEALGALDPEGMYAR
jgi:hypothetical protein